MDFHDSPDVEPRYTDGKAAVEHGNDFYARRPIMMLKPEYRRFLWPTIRLPELIAKLEYI